MILPFSNVFPYINFQLKSFGKIMILIGKVKKGNNSKSITGKLMVLVLDTLFYKGLSLHEVSVRKLE